MIWYVPRRIPWRIHLYGTHYTALVYVLFITVHFSQFHKKSDKSSVYREFTDSLVYVYTVYRHVTHSLVSLHTVYAQFTCILRAVYVQFTEFETQFTHRLQHSLQLTHPVDRLTRLHVAIVPSATTSSKLSQTCCMRPNLWDDVSIPTPIISPPTNMQHAHAGNSLGHTCAHAHANYIIRSQMEFSQTL